MNYPSAIMTITDFDEWADTYNKTENVLMRKYIEKPTVISLLKDVQGQVVLDLACGEGNYARMLRGRGAAHVLGIDMSEKMIAEARQLEQKRPLGIDYLVQDVRMLERVGWFDIATAVYLFPHAQTKQDLVDMAQSIFKNLKPNGRLIALTSNPAITARHLAAPEKYGVHVSLEGPIQEGALLRIKYPGVQNGHPDILNYHWSTETYEWALKKAGFRQIQWHPMLIAAEGIRTYGESFWREYVTAPHLIVIECHK